MPNISRLVQVPRLVSLESRCQITRSSSQELICFGTSESRVVLQPKAIISLTSLRYPPPLAPPHCGCALAASWRVVVVVDARVDAAVDANVDGGAPCRAWLLAFTRTARGGGPLGLEMASEMGWKYKKQSWTFLDMCDSRLREDDTKHMQAPATQIGMCHTKTHTHATIKNMSDVLHTHPCQMLGVARKAGTKALKASLPDWHTSMTKQLPLWEPPSWPLAWSILVRLAGDGSTGLSVGFPSAGLTGVLFCLPPLPPCVEEPQDWLIPAREVAMSAFSNICAFFFAPAAIAFCHRNILCRFNSLATRSFCLCYRAQVGVDEDAVSIWLLTSGFHCGSTVSGQARIAFACSCNTDKRFFSSAFSSVVEGTITEALVST